MQKDDKGAQTIIFVSPHIVQDDRDLKVRCLRATQTVAQINFDTPYERTLTFLAFTPFSEIKKDCVAIRDLPRKNILQFKEPTDEEEASTSGVSLNATVLNASNSVPNNLNVINPNASRPSTEISGNKSISYEGSSSIIYKSNLKKPKSMEKNYKEAEMQTNIIVRPHILEEDEVATVARDMSAQTSVTFDPKDTPSFIAEELHKKISHSHDAIAILDTFSKFNVSEKLPEKEDVIKTVPSSNYEILSDLPSNDDDPKIDMPHRKDTKEESEKIRDAVEKKESAVQDYGKKESVKEESEKQDLAEEEFTTKESVVDASAKKGSVKIEEESGEESEKKESLEDETEKRESVKDDFSKMHESIGGEFPKKDSTLRGDASKEDATTRKFTGERASSLKAGEDPKSSVRIMDPWSKQNMWTRSFSLQPETVKTTSTIDMTPSSIQLKIKHMMDETVKSLEERLQRMVCEIEKPGICRPIDPNKFQDRKIQSSTMADHIVGGDCIGRKHANVLCECDCSGGAGAAVPQLRDPVPPPATQSIAKSFIAKEDNIQQTVTVQVTISAPDNVAHKTAPDPNEQNIRLPMMRNKPKFCHCAKSDTCHKCTTGKMEKKLTGVKSTAQNIGLLVDQDGEYADAYLELLEQDQTGTQTEQSDLDSSDLDYEIRKPKECVCTQNIEMPWDLITFCPREKKKASRFGSAVDTSKAGQEEGVDAGTRSRSGLKELTVTRIDQKQLLELTQNMLSDGFAGEDLNLSEIEKQIIDEAGVDSETPPVELAASVNDPTSATSANERKSTTVELEAVKDTDYFAGISIPSEDEESVAEKVSYPKPKPRPFQVYDPSCERHNEPYMDRMYRYFPDECDDLDQCPSHIEMPWTNILLPKNCLIRKIYKPPKSSEDKNKPPRKCGPEWRRDNTHESSEAKTAKSGNKVTKSNTTNAGFDIKISFAELSSKIFPVENAARDQLSINTTFSNLVYKPKRAPKTFVLKGSFSQPFMVQGELNKTVPTKPKTKSMSNTASKESNLMRVMNFGEKNKDDCSKTSKTSNIKNYTSMPQIGSKVSISKKQTGSKVNNTDRISALLESCKREMEPIKDGINKLRARIRELNLPDITSYQEPAQRQQGLQQQQQQDRQGYASTRITFGASYGSLLRPVTPIIGAEMPFMHMPMYPPYLPYCPHYQMPPCCYPQQQQQQQQNQTRKSRPKMKPYPRKTKSSSYTSSTEPYSDGDDFVPVKTKNEQPCGRSSSKAVPRDSIAVNLSRISKTSFERSKSSVSKTSPDLTMYQSEPSTQPKKPRPSKIPKRCIPSVCDTGPGGAQISQVESIGSKTSQGTLTDRMGPTPCNSALKFKDEKPRKSCAAGKSPRGTLESIQPNGSACFDESPAGSSQMDETDSPKQSKGNAYTVTSRLRFDVKSRGTNKFKVETSDKSCDVKCVSSCARNKSKIVNDDDDDNDDQRGCA